LLDCVIAIEPKWRKVSRFKLVAIDAWWLWVMESLDDYEIDDEESVSKLELESVSKLEL